MSQEERQKKRMKRRGRVSQTVFATCLPTHLPLGNSHVTSDSLNFSIRLSVWALTLCLNQAKAKHCKHLLLKQT